MFVNIDTQIKFIRIWLLIMFCLTTLIIFVGGLTRLTDSGLSITQWELFKGIVPPFNNDIWNYYFNEYKKIPEFREINYNMTINEFKVIYYWEYGHRLLARLIGLFSIVPLILFYYSFRVKLSKNYKYLSIFILICIQGLIGWFMVKSGLSINTDVSHFRLALHLNIALIILSIIFWFILQTFKIQKFFNKINYVFLNFFLFFIFLQITLGAFLAGLNGGLIYNTWPDMNGNFLPNDIIHQDLVNHNVFNNPSVIQFYHRLNSYILLCFLIILNLIFLKSQNNLKSILMLNFAIFFQILLGILTLITGVKIYYASLHQLGSILVMISFLFIYYKNTN